MTPAQENPDRLLSSREMAAVLGVSTVTLSRWRSDGKGPPFLRLSRQKAAYRLRDVRAWMDAQVIR